MFFNYQNILFLEITLILLNVLSLPKVSNDIMILVTYIPLYYMEKVKFHPQVSTKEYTIKYLKGVTT